VEQEGGVGQKVEKGDCGAKEKGFLDSKQTKIASFMVNCPSSTSQALQIPHRFTNGSLPPSVTPSCHSAPPQPSKPPPNRLPQSPRTVIENRGAGPGAVLEKGWEGRGEGGRKERGGDCGGRRNGRRNERKECQRSEQYDGCCGPYFLRRKREGRRNKI
jgi:hypothetical protein